MTIVIRNGISTDGLIKHLRFGRNRFNCSKFERLARDLFFMVISTVLSIKSESEPQVRTTKTIALVEKNEWKKMKKKKNRIQQVGLIAILYLLCGYWPLRTLWLMIQLCLLAERVPTVNGHDTKIHYTHTHTHSGYMWFTQNCYFFCSLCSVFSARHWERTGEIEMKITQKKKERNKKKRHSPYDWGKEMMNWMQSIQQKPS